MAVSHSTHHGTNDRPHKKPCVYFKLGAHAGRIEIHVSRSTAKAMFTKLGRILAKRARGHRSWHCAVVLQGRCWTRLTVETHSAHRRKCADKYDLARPWVTR
jgi:hypothetical protein